MTLIQMAFLAVVAIVIALFVVRPLLRSKPTSSVAELGPPLALNQMNNSDSTLTSKFDIGRDFDGSPVAYDGDALPATLPDIDTSFGDIGDSPVQRLRDMIENRQDETIDILRQWLEQKEQKSS